MPSKVLPFKARAGTPKSRISEPRNDLQPILIVPDCHIPFEDKRAWRLFIKIARAFKPFHLVALGDLGDFFAVSSHLKDPSRMTTFDQELRAIHIALDELDSLGATHKYFIEGNHEDRLRRYLQEKAPELYGVVGVEALFKLHARGWHFTKYKYDTKIGKLYFTHDVGTAGRYSVYRALDTYQHSVITAHTHRLGYIVEGNAIGEYKLSANFGWLGDREQIDYMVRANVNKNWALGFGVGYIHAQSGIAYLSPVPIIDYTAVVNGKLYTEAA